MSTKCGTLILILLFSISLNLKSQSGISGQITIDTTIWAPIAYISLISDFDDLNTMSNEMIIEKTIINNSGQFHFNTKYFTDADNLFRIHISKRGDPPASLIIGGKDENHFFLIANKNSSIIIRSTSKSEFIQGVTINGYYPNQILQKIDEITSYLDTTNFNGSQLKRELIKGAIFDKLRSIADTCKNPLVGLYALYISKFEKNYPTNQQYYKNFLTRWKQERSSYFIEFRKKFPQSVINGTKFPYLIIALSLIIGFLACFVYLRLFKKNHNPLRELSVQERKILALIIEGKSNKEISDILKIGLSTVKSHVNSIYTKLGINSRKEVLNLNLAK